jgi:tyrosinase
MSIESNTRWQPDRRGAARDRSWAAECCRTAGHKLQDAVLRYEGLVRAFKALPRTPGRRMVGLQEPASGESLFLCEVFPEILLVSRFVGWQGVGDMRLSLMCIIASSGMIGLAVGVALAEPPQVLIELNDSVADTDDYLCWSPVEGRARLAGTAATPVDVVLRSDGTPAGGAVWFQADDGAMPTPASFNPSPELELSLPGDGTWVRFWSAGRRASSGSKDVRIVASVDTSEAGSLPVMVRVRKNAETLSQAEITQILEAIKAVHDLANGGVSSELLKYARVHDDAFRLGIHGSPLFFPWHRAFLLAFERELQAIDPRVSLPYWRFDRATTQIFIPEFMGTVQGGPNEVGGFLVQFATTNPLFGWRMPTGSGLVRAFDANNPAVAGDELDFVLQLPTYSVVSSNVEANYHNDAHNAVSGWLGSRSSPRDPMFFLLHANVDRAWAHWQARQQKFDPLGTDPASYSALGSYPGPSDPLRFRQGVYALDQMWPWNGRGGNQGTPDPGDDWPSLAFPMITAPAGGPGPSLPPTVIGQVDYLDVNGRGLAHGACYDDIDYRGQTPEGAPT